MYSTLHKVLVERGSDVAVECFQNLRGQGFHRILKYEINFQKDVFILLINGFANFVPTGSFQFGNYILC